MRGANWGGDVLGLDIILVVPTKARIHIGDGLLVGGGHRQFNRLISHLVGILGDRVEELAVFDRVFLRLAGIEAHHQHVPVLAPCPVEYFQFYPFKV